MVLRNIPNNAAMMACLMCMWAQSPAFAQGDTPPPQGTSRGENFSAKPPAALFASDCTGAGCHKGPQGLSKGQSQGSLAGFLREHYTNSRQSAAALAGYLSGLPSAPEQKETRPTRPAQPGAAPSRAAVRAEDDPPTPPASVGNPRRTVEPAETQQKPNPNARPPRARSSTTAATAPPPEPPPAAPPPPPFDIFD